MGVDRFLTIILFVLGNEGGYVCNPHDPGGETKFGISKRSYPHLDIKNLTRDDAVAIYKRDFWDTHPFDKINDFNLCKKLFDESVNMGFKEAAKLLQKAIGTVKADGVLGPATLKAINSADPVKLLAQYKESLADFYKNLVKKHPLSAEFIHGWLRRAYQ